MKMDKAYQQLVEETQRIANETKEPERHVIKALSYQIRAIGDLDDQLEALNSSINRLNKTTAKLMTRQIWLIIIQIVMTIIIGWAAIKLT